MFDRLNDGALDAYLRGEHGELLRRMAMEEFAQRGGTDFVRVTLGELADILRSDGRVLCEKCASVEAAMRLADRLTDRGRSDPEE